MSNLTDLVPPLNLCKLIPQGEFTDAYAMWVKAWAEKDLEIDGEKVVTITMVIPKQKIIILPEPPTDEQREILKTRFPDAILCKEIYFAPTTDEILDKCKDIPGVLNPTLWWQGIWKADCAIDKSGKLSEEFFDDADLDNLDLACAEDKSAATAALKLWLKLKGIEA